MESEARDCCETFNTMPIVFPIALRATAAAVDIVGLQLDGVQIDPKEWWDSDWIQGSHCETHTLAGVQQMRQAYRRSGQIKWWAVQDSNLRPPACKAGALTN
jgi:hypothetical protein